MVGPDLAGIEQAPKQRIASAGNRMQRAGAIEGISGFERLRMAGAATTEVDFQRLAGVARGEDAPGEDLEPPFADQLREGARHLWRDAVPVNVPPWPRVAQEA